MNQKLNEILKSLREKSNLSQEELAQKLKTTIAQIEILEKGEFEKLPKINLLRILEKYENFFNVELINLINQENFFKEEKNIFKNNNYKLINYSYYLLIGFLVIILSLVFFQLSNLIFPPKIKILYPYDGLVINQKNLIIKGYVDRRSTLYLNNKEIVYDDNGYFEVLAVLKPGLNKFEFLAKNYWGLKKKIIINVYYQSY